MKTLKNFTTKISVLVACFLALGGAPQNKSVVSPLEGKTFTIVLTEHNSNLESSSALSDEITFVNKKVYSKTMRSYGLEAGNYYFRTDTLKGKSGILFVGENNDNSGNTLFFAGRVSGSHIEGTVKWFSKSKTWKFSGELKYATAEK